MATKKRGLGRGLDDLLSKVSIAAAEVPLSDSSIKTIAVEHIKPGQYQPRKNMDSGALNDLAASIKAHGILQPVIVRELAYNDFELIAGERRWRAAQLAGLNEVPVIIKAVPDEAVLALALIENIQREDLNAIEEANALQRLLEEFSLTHQQVADSVGRSRVAVSNLLRLLNLHKDVRSMLEHGDLEMGHARALLPLEPMQQLELARVIVTNGLTAREAERLVKRFSEDKSDRKPPQKPLDPDVAALQRRLSEKLSAGVQIQHNVRGKGKIVIKYTSLDELEGILSHIE